MSIPPTSSPPPPLPDVHGFGFTDMNVDQYVEDMDDLEILGSHSPTTPMTMKSKSTTGTFPASNSSTIDKSNCKRKTEKKDKSEVWEYFRKIGLVDGILKCECKRCKSQYTYGAGTTHLRRHIPKCYKNPQLHDVSSLLDNQATLVKRWKFDGKAFRDALSRCIIRHDLPFSFAEYEGLSALCKVLNPDFKSVSRNTAKVDCKNLFLSEKEKLKSVLATIPGRICLTSDVWTAVTTQGYMAVTAHYVDGNWKLNSKLLSFCVLESPHTGLELCGRLFEVLKDWEIDSKIFSLTLDNASNNDNMQKLLKGRLNLQNDLLCKGEFFHVRCCAHILNIIVQEGLKATGHALEKVRESVKYVKSSEGRLQNFQKSIEEVRLSNVGGSFLRLDVATRWNATYMMLESAIKYRRAFTCLSYKDTNYKLCPTDEEWERAERVCDFLAPFYRITNLISGSSYPTSNLYFMEVASIEMKLNENLECEDELIKDMASRMKVKFDKYWSEYSVTLALGCVLDPKAKLHFLDFCYRMLYPLNYKEKMDRVKEALYKLFGEYKSNGAASNSFSPNSSNQGPSSARSNPHMNASRSSSSTMSSILNVYCQQMMEKSTSSESKSQLDIYLEEGSPVGIESDLDVLEYWKMNKHRFPQLAIMACDILSIPITTVASESTFSIGGRILHKYRNCLLPENVQALICTRSWLHGFKEIGHESDAPDVEEIQLSTQASNVVTLDE